MYNLVPQIKVVGTKQSCTCVNQVCGGGLENVSRVAVIMPENCPHHFPLPVGNFRNSERKAANIFDGLITKIAVTFSFRQSRPEIFSALF